MMTFPAVRFINDWDRLSLMGLCTNCYKFQTHLVEGHFRAHCKVYCDKYEHGYIIKAISKKVYKNSTEAKKAIKAYYGIKRLRRRDSVEKELADRYVKKELTGSRY